MVVRTQNISFPKFATAKIKKRMVEDLVWSLALYT